MNENVIEVYEWWCGRKIDVFVDSGGMKDHIAQDIV